MLNFWNVFPSRPSFRRFLYWNMGGIICLLMLLFDNNSNTFVSQAYAQPYGYGNPYVGPRPYGRRVCRWERDPYGRVIKVCRIIVPRRHW